MPQSPQFSDLALLRQLPLNPLAIWLSYRQDPEDPRRWKRDDSILSINHGKIFDHLPHTGGYGAIDLVAHARSCSDRAPFDFSRILPTIARHRLPRLRRLQITLTTQLVGP